MENAIIDFNFENFIYKMDILDDNHISEIVLGKHRYTKN